MVKSNITISLYVAMNCYEHFHNRYLLGDIITSVPMFAFIKQIYNKLFFM